MVDAEGRAIPFGELATRFKERGCSGDGGSELDLLNALRTGVSRPAFDCGAFEGGASTIIGALIAFKPAFTISVARIAFSLAESNPGVAMSFNAVPREAWREGGRVVFAAFVCVVIRPRAVIFDAAPSLSSSLAGLSKRSSLRVDTVVGEHVVGDVMALLTESIFALRQVMLCF